MTNPSKLTNGHSDHRKSIAQTNAKFPYFPHGGLMLPDAIPCLGLASMSSSLCGHWVDQKHQLLMRHPFKTIST